MSWSLESQSTIGEHQKIRRYRLHNGLTLVCVADHEAPIIAYQTWFAVGSRNETKGATGLAHLFEHLMFNQTKNMAPGEFDRRIEAIGGDSNAATWTDWTYYRNSVPATALALIVELEAERMTSLVLEHDVVEAERAVVMNERLERVDDDVDGFASEQLFRHSFTTHPYHAPTIGWMEDIEGLTVPEIQSFYQRYYTPDNATLVVVGDFREKDLLAAIEASYGDIPAANHPTQIFPQEPEQCQERQFDYYKEVNAARLLIGYKGPAQMDADWADVMFTCQFLAGSASCPLYRQLAVENELVSSLFCDVMPFADPSLIEFTSTATDGTSLDVLQTTIDSTLQRLSSSMPKESDIHKVRNLVETEFWTGLSTIDGKAEALGHYQCVHGDYKMLFAMAKRLSNITPHDVRRVLTTYLQPDRRTIVRVLPNDDNPS